MKIKFKKINLNSIRTKLIISLVTICIIPLIITGFGSYNQSKLILNKKLTLTSTQTLSEINNGLLDYFKGFSDKVVLTANNPSFMNSDNNTSMLLDVLKSVKESDKDILCMYYGTESGDFSTYPLEEMPEGYDATTRPWYKQAIENKGKVVISSPYEDAGTGTNLVTFARTVEKNG